MRTRQVLLPALLLAVAALLLFLLLSRGAPESEETSGGGAANGSVPPDATLVGTKDAATPMPTAPLVEAPPLEEPAPGGPDRCSLYGTVTRGRSPCAAKIEVRRVAEIPANGTVWEQDYARYAGHLADPGTGEVVARAEAGEDGAYEVRGLPAGRYEVRARQGEDVGTRQTVDLLPEGRRVRLALALPDGRFTLRGRLLHADGTPWEGYLLIEPETNTLDASWRVDRPLDAEGRFTIAGLPRGPLRVSATQFGTLSVTRYRSLSVPHEGEWTWVVDQGLGSVEARVVDAAEGTPVGGAPWMVLHYRTSSMLLACGRTDAEGRCRLPYVENWEYSNFAVSAPGYVPARASTPWEDPLVLRLERAARVEGRVTDAGTGHPVPGARVCLVGEDERSRGTAITDAEGRYALDGLPEGRCVLYAVGSGWVSVEIDDGVRAAAGALTVQLGGGRTTRRDLHVRRAPRILGRVLDADGTPVAGALVEASLHQRQPPLVVAQLAALGAAGFGELLSPVAEQMAAETTSREDGVYVLDGLTPGLAYTVGAAAPQRHPVASERLVVPATGVQRLDLTFPPPRWLEVQVVDAWSGDPVRGASVSHTGTGQEDWVETTTDGEGLGRLGPLGEEVSSLDVEAEGYQGREGIPVEDGASEVTIRLERGLVLTGRVLLPDGSPLAGHWVDIMRLGDSNEVTSQCAFALTDETGRFETRSLWPGRYVVQSQDRWIDPTAVGSVEAEAGDHDVVLRLRKR